MKGSHILEHTRHANLILQRANTNRILGIERQRKLVLGNLTRQKRLIQKELSTHRSTPVSTSPCPRSCLELSSKTPAFSRQETRSATLRREAIAFGTNNTAYAGPCSRPIASALKKPTEIFKSRESIDSSDDEDRERKTSASNTVDLLFEGLTVSRRTQESLKKSENDKDALGDECVNDHQVKLSRSSPNPKLPKTVSFVESRNRTYLNRSLQKPNTPNIYQNLTPSPTLQRETLPRSCRSAQVSAVPHSYYKRGRTQSLSFSSHKNTSFTQNRVSSSRVPQSTPWAMRGNGRVYRYRPFTRPADAYGRESHHDKNEPTRKKTAKFDPWAAYKFPSVEPNQSEESTHGRQSVFESRRRGSLKPTLQRKEETVLYLRRVDQSRVNEIVLGKVGKFLGRNWTQSQSQKDVDEDSLSSDVIDDEEDQLMIQMAHGRK